jgi:hypothetical protein
MDIIKKLAEAVAAMRKAKIPLRQEERKWRKMMKTKEWTPEQQAKLKERP